MEEGRPLTSRYVLYCGRTGYVQDIDGPDGPHTLRQAREALAQLQVPADQLGWWSIAVQVSDLEGGESVLDFFTPLEWEDSLVLRQLNDPPVEG